MRIREADAVVDQPRHETLHGVGTAPIPLPFGNGTRQGDAALPKGRQLKILTRGMDLRYNHGPAFSR